MRIACGQCIGCRLERSRQWAVRCFHEAQLYEDNAFITLTYEDRHLPPNGTLVKRDFQLFMKRLRKHFGTKIRYFHCGEYGEKFKRPHYHACLFNVSFPDRVLIRNSNTTRLYTSEILSTLWGKGFVSIGDVTFETAAYCARYVVKKITGKKAEDHYTRIDPDTGEVYEMQPEYVTMSRRPGIGRPWLDKFKRDVYPEDEVVVRGKSMKPPKFYDTQLERQEPELLEKLKDKRKKKGFDNRHDNTDSRLRVKELVQLYNLKQLKRSYENET